MLYQLSKGQQLNVVFLNAAGKELTGQEQGHSHLQLCILRVS